ncbi:unnamed protein product [Paramecium pentaurelia]|uniref:EF-hand domain-containing protein n=1 Tax=Paramecium pentaurelia TaxID=43138 RepID=A0A8S1YGU8_9CILI|nr:unnamed protein product [Paramecium pentaurelia]
MINSQTKKKLLKLFNKLEEYEIHSESMRQILCQQDEFEPYSVFKKICNSGHISSQEIYQLLQQNGMIVQLEQVNPIIKWYSQKCDNRLTYADFLQIVLPANNLELRNLVSQKPTFAKDISYEIEYGVCRIFYKEIQIADEIQAYKQDLVQSPDFDYRITFQTIDQFNSGFIQLDLLEHFVDRDCNALMRRLDQNRDSQIDLEDFRIALEPQYGNIYSQKSSASTVTSVKQIEVQNQFPNRRAKQSVAKHIDRNKKIVQQKKVQCYDMDYLAEALKIISELEYENEFRKEELGYLQYDFLELFSFFDQDKTGKLAPGDVKSALEELEIYPTQSQLYLWMKRYDIDRDGKWNVREFLAAFKPINYQKINTRQLDKEILNAVKNVIKTEIENEVAIECIRKKLSQRPNFNLKSLFAVITSNQIIVEQELRTFLENHGVYLDEKNRELLMRRFDRNEQQYITYSDFLNEMQPKQPKN